MIHGFIGSGTATVAAALLAMGQDATSVHKVFLRFIRKVWRRDWHRPFVTDRHLGRYLRRLFGNVRMCDLSSGLIVPMTCKNVTKTLCNNHLFDTTSGRTALCIPTEPVWRIVWRACRNPLRLSRGALKPSTDISVEPAGHAIHCLNPQLSRTCVLSLGAGYIDPECWLHAATSRSRNRTIVDMTNQHLRDNASASVEAMLGSRYCRINPLFTKPVKPCWRSDIETCVVAAKRLRLPWCDIERVFEDDTVSL